MTRPLLLDAYCGAGGAAVGYHRAGFDVVGVDIAPQKNYPFEFHQGDALEFVARYGREFDAIHASPPCQRYSRATKQAKGVSALHPDLIGPTRDALWLTDRPYVIENVAFAPLMAPMLLCGAMFPGLRTYRHRLFESDIALSQPPHPRHSVRCPRSNVWVPGLFMTVYGHVSPVDKAREVMGIDWPMTRTEVVQAIPPAYTSFVGAQLLEALAHERRSAS